MVGRLIKVPFAEWWQTFEKRSYPGVDAKFIHALDDPDVMASNGTIALELLAVSGVGQTTPLKEKCA